MDIHLVVAVSVGVQYSDVQQYTRAEEMVGGWLMGRRVWVGSEMYCTVLLYTNQAKCSIS